MKRLSLLLSSLSFIGVGLIAPSFMNTSNSVTTLIDPQAVPKNVSIENKKIDVSEANAVVLRTDPINLTKLGIQDNNGLHEYDYVELPDFKITFLTDSLGNIVNSGYKWGAKMSEGEGMYQEVDRLFVRNGIMGDWYTAVIERKHSLWYDSDGNYNLALVYKLSCYTQIPGAGSFYGRVRGEVGSVVKFY